MVELDDTILIEHLGGRPLEIPRRIGAYRVQEVLASGGFGVVCRAEHVERGAPVALKVLHAELASSREAIARFEREVVAIRRVRHPNVIEIFDVGQLDDGRPYFTMELLGGVSLEDHLALQGRLPPDEVLAIAEPLCAAVAAAHAESIIHRDIKASNVFLCGGAAAGAEPGPRRRVVLLDFGIAKLLDAEGPGLTMSRHVVGTVACMAPEQILGQPVDERADVYALGALVYRMLTGEPPFSGRSLLALEQMILHADPRPPGSLSPVGPSLDAPVLRALSKRPLARQPDARAFLEELFEAAGRPRDGRERRALALYIEVWLADEAAEDDQAFEDMEGIIPLARDTLEPAGFSVALATGSSALLGLTLPEDPGRDREERRRAIGAVSALSRRLSARPGRSAGVGVRLCLHAGSATTNSSGVITGGPLMHITAWVPEVPAEAPLASAAAVAGLDASAGAAAGTTGWFELPA